MLSVWLIRHAESEANAGLKTSDPTSTSLTEKGWEQAQVFAQSLTEEPALIITSPYQRAKQTAVPTLARFPHVPTLVWSIQEFTYLCPKRYQNTTQRERSPYVQAFWERADPFYCDGEGAESFAQFFERVKQAKTWLEHMEKGPVFLFGHGQFIRTLLFLLLTQKIEIDQKVMNYIGNFIQAFYVPNASVMKCWFLPQGEVHFSTVITSHLSKELQT